MRKVLLATTALVALGGVSAATADVSVSGSGTWNYRSWSDKHNETTAAGDDTSTSTSTSFTISGATTADSGMEFGGSHTITDGAANGASLYISDDWGKITMGGGSAGRANNSFFKNTAASGGTGDMGTAATSGLVMSGVMENTRIGGAGGGMLNYTSPSVNGIVVAASMKDAGADNASHGDETAWSISYDTDVSGIAVGVDYSSVSVDAAPGAATTDKTSMGLTAAMGDITVMVASASSENSTGTTKIDTTDYGIKYAVNSELTVEAGALTSENDVTNGAKHNKTHIGVSYVPAAGLELEASNTSFDYTAAGAGSTKDDGSETRVSVKVTF